MRTPIWLRILVAVDLLVIVAAAAIGWFSSEIAGKVVEERLIRATTRKTGEFLEGQNLPFTDTLMGYLRRMHGAQFVTIRVRDGRVVGSSLPAELSEQLRARAGSLGTAGVLELGDVRYRYDSHAIAIRTRPYGTDTESARLYAFVPQDEFEDARALASRRIARVTLPVLAAASVIAIVLALTIARPIRKLAARMQAIETDKLALRAHPAPADAPGRGQRASQLRGPREVVRLARSFDHLMARLAEAQDDVARHERLATLGRVAASVVHELRNPLSGIRMNLRVLEEELGDRDVHSESLEASLREIERMGVYLDELTDLASGPDAADSAAPLRLGSLAPVRLDELADSALAVFAGRCRHSGIDVRTHYDRSVPSVRGDAERLRQVMMNLIVNALDAMPSGGTLEVSVDGRGRCTITDTGADTTLAFAHQRVKQNDAWRAHKTIYGISWEGTDVGSELERSLDQDRRLTYVQYRSADRGSFVDAVTATVSYHAQEEARFRARANDRFDRQGFEVGTLGASVQLESPSSAGRWVYGVECYHDSVDSFANKLNADGSIKSSSIQGPVADDATYGLLGVFVEDDIPIHEKLDLILGARYTVASVDADKVEDPTTGDEISLSDEWGTVVGSARVLYRIGDAEQWRLFGGVSQGFRAPNLSDLTRLDTARSNEIETPSPGLDPEEFISYEIGVKGSTDSYTTQLAYFYTDISDMIVRTPTGRVIDENNEVTKQNAGDGFVHGVELSATYRFHPQLSAFGSFVWTDGEVDTYPTSDPVLVREPIDRLMPPTGIGGLRWEHPSKECWVEALVTIAGKQDDLSTRDRADTQRIPPGGTPGYTVLTLRGGWEIGCGVTVTTVVENVTDEAYRIHGSGQNEPGRNFVVALDWRF